MLDKLALEQKVQAFKNQMPEYKNYNDEQILSVMIQCGYITEDELREISSFYKAQEADNTGLALQTNRSLDDVLLKDGGNNLVFESKDGKRYNLNAVLNQRFGKIKKDLKSAEDSNGWIGKLWSGTKNLFGFGDSSNKVREQQDREQQLLMQFNADNPNKAQIFKELTGLDFTPENIEAFITGEAKLKSEQALDGYKEGQEMASDMGGDIISGIAAVGIYSLAVAAIPLTGGLSLAAGFAAAGIAGGLVKQGVKWTDGKQPNRKDFVTGAVSGLLAPFTGGLGGAVGKSVAKTLGIQAVKQMGKEGAEVAAIAAGKQAAKGGFKKWAMTTFTNPTGYQYGAKTQGIKGLLNLFTTKLGWKKVGATASEMMVDGALGGGLDGAFRAGYVEGADAEGMLQAGIMGFVGGAALAPVIGGGMKAVGKLGHKAGFKGPVAKLSDDELIKSYKEFPDNPNFLTAEQSETLAQVSEELTKRGLLKQGELVEPKGKPLEGNIGDKELDEVAPFAKHAEEEPQVGDIVLPDKSKHVLEDGIYDKDGNFIPDGIVTTYEGGKSVTRKIMPNGMSYPVATTFRDLVKQLKRDLKREKFSKWQLQALKRFLENNPDFKVSDLSEMFINAKCLHWQHSLFEHISYLSNARTVRDNLNILAKFDSTPERSTLRISKQLQELNKDYRFFDELGKTDSELLSKNLELLDEMSYGIKEDEYFYLKSFLFKEHNPQLKERIRLIREFNDSLTEFNQTANEYHGGLNRLERYILDILESDEKFAILKEKMEVVKEAYKYSPEWAQNMLRDHYNPSQAPAFKLFIQALPEGKRFERILRTFANLQDSSPERAAKYLEFCQNIPEDRLAQMVKNETYNNCNKVWNELLRYNIKPEELDQLIQKAKILSKFPKIIGTVGWSSNKSPDMSQVEQILLATYNQPLEKIVQFLDLADERYLAHYNMERFQATFMTGRNIDTMLENARLHQDLNPDFVKFINTEREGGYDNQKYLDYTFDPQKTKARIETVNNLYGKLDNRILEDIYFGKLPCRKNVLDAISKIDPDTYKAITQYRQIEKFDQFSDSALEILPDLLNRLKPYKEKDGYCDFDNNVLSDNFINLINNLTREEINCINPQSFIRLRFSEYTFDPKIIRENFAQIPPNIREIISMADTDCNILTSYSWFFKEGPDKIIRAKAAFDYISSAIESGSLTLDDFRRLGPTYLKRFIDNYSYERGVKSVNMEEIKFLRELPLDFLQKAESYIPELLKRHSEIDTSVISSRFNLLRKYPENYTALNSHSMHSIAMAKEEKFKIIELLLKHKYKKEFDPLNYAISSLPSSNTCKEEYDYIVKILINNPENDVNVLKNQLSYIFEKTGADTDLLNLRKNIIRTLISEKNLSSEHIPNLLFDIGLCKNAKVEDLIFKDILKHLRDGNINSKYVKDFYNLISNYSSKGIKEVKAYLECLEILTNRLEHNKIRDFLRSFDPRNITTRKQLLVFLNQNGNIDSGHLQSIIANTTENNIRLAKKLCQDTNTPHEDISHILKTLGSNPKREAFIEAIYNSDNFNNKYLIKICDYLKNDNNDTLLESLSSVMSSPQMQKWVEKNLNENVSLETIVSLSRTQKKLYNEANTRKPKIEQSDKPKVVKPEAAKPEEIVQAEEMLVSLGVHPKMAPNYVKMCHENGIVDKLRLDAVCALAQAGVPVKEIKNIFALAVGSPLSNANGVFRPDIIRDIVRFKNAGIDDIKLAANMAAVKNMPDVELKSRLNSKTREDFAKRINELPPEIRERLITLGIDLDGMSAKATAAPKKVKVDTEAKPKPVQLRALDDIVGTERVILNKYKNEIDQSIWGDPVRFRAWAEDKLKKVLDFEQNPDYTATGAYAQVNPARKEGIENWYKYLTEESHYRDDVFVHLLVMDGITKDMKPNSAYVPPAVSHGSFEATYNALLETNTHVSFSKIYAESTRTNAIRQFGKPREVYDGIEGQWVTIPRSQKGEPNYDEHIAMVQALAEGSSWCLRFDNAHTYLQRGNLHFFVDINGSSQVAINETDGVITQIQKRYRQDSTVPVPYARVIEKWAKENNYRGLEEPRQTALAAKQKFDELRNRLKIMQKQQDWLAIFKELGINVKKADDDTYIIDTYKARINDCSLIELGVDENALMRNVSVVESDLNLEGSGLTALPNLRIIKGRLILGDNKISDLSGLESLNGKNIYWDK